MAELVAANRERLQAMPDSDALRNARFSCWERNERIVALASDRESTAAGFVDLLGLADAVDREITDLQASRNPYVSPGDVWRAVACGNGSVPSRVFVPSALPDAERSLPLLVTLHGAGGDENMFFEAYGGGRALPCYSLTPTSRATTARAATDH